MSDHCARPTVDNGRGMREAVLVQVCRVCHRAIERADTTGAVPSPWRHVTGAPAPKMRKAVAR